MTPEITLGGHWLQMTIADAWFSVHGVALAPDASLTIAEIAATLTQFAQGVADFRQRELAADLKWIDEQFAALTTD